MRNALIAAAVLILAAMALGGKEKTDEEAGRLLIGWDSRDIVPDRPVFLRGMPTARVAKNVLDPVTVTALAIEEKNGARAIMVSADLCAIDTGTLSCARAELGRLVPDFDPGLMVVNATHTHTSLSGIEGIYPPPEGDCMTPAETAAFMGGRIAAAAAAAWSNRSAGAVAWGRGQAVVGHNRRVCYFSGETKMYGKTSKSDFSHIEGYEDHGVDLLFTYDARKQLSGMIVNLACPAQCSEHLSVISADFWHETRLEIRKQVGTNIFILPQCSAAGDQSPRLLLYKNAEMRMMALKEDVPIGRLDFDMARRREIGRRIAAAVAEVMPLAARDIREQVPFRHEKAILALPALPISEADAEEARKEITKAEERLQALDIKKDWQEYSRHHRQLHRYKRLLQRYESQQESKTIQAEIHVMRLGDVAFATNPYELFLDFGLQIKARSPALQTFLVQLAGNASYVPTARAVAGKGYGAEPVSNPVGPEGGRKLVEETLKIICAMWPATETDERK